MTWTEENAGSDLAANYGSLHLGLTERSESTQACRAAPRRRLAPAHFGVALVAHANVVCTAVVHVRVLPIVELGRMEHPSGTRES